MRSIRCSKNENHTNFNLNKHKCIEEECNGVLQKFCFICNNWKSKSNFSKHICCTNQNQITNSNIIDNQILRNKDVSDKSSLLNFNEISMMLNTISTSASHENSKGNKNTIKIIEGWPSIIKTIDISSTCPKNTISTSSLEVKRECIKKIIQFIFNNDMKEAFLLELERNVEINDKLNKIINIHKEQHMKDGAKLQMEEMKCIELNESFKEMGLLISSNGSETKRKVIELVSKEECLDSSYSKISKLSCPNYLKTKEIKDLIINYYNRHIVNQFAFLNKSETAREISKYLEKKYQLNLNKDLIKIINALNSNKGGLYTSLIYVEIKELPLLDLVKKKLKRSYKRSSLNVIYHGVTEKQRKNYIEQKSMYGMDFTDSEIIEMYKNKYQYIGHLLNDEETTIPTLIRDLRTVFGLILLKIIDLDGFIENENSLEKNYEINLIHWTDGTTLLGSGFLLACVSIEFNDKIFKKEKHIIDILKTWIPFFMSFVKETKLGLSFFLKYRNNILDRLLLPLKINNLVFNFNLLFNIGDLSLIWKLFGLNSQFCGHCEEKVVDSFPLTHKLSKRRNIENNIENFSKSEAGCQFEVKFSELEKRSNTATIVDILHTTKGVFETVESLFIDIDENLNRQDISIVNGGVTRKFFINYNSWFSKLIENLESLAITKKSNFIEKVKVFKENSKNTELLLFLLSELTKVLYSSSLYKKESIYFYLEFITTFIYIIIRRRYGVFGMNKHFHNLICHTPQDYCKINQRFCSCERGEYLLSLLKRVSLTESNRSKCNALERMCLTIVADFERMLSGDKNSITRSFEDYEISINNFTITNYNNDDSDLNWFKDKYISFIGSENIIQQNNTTLQFIFDKSVPNLTIDFTVTNVVINEKTKEKSESKSVRCNECGKVANIKCNKSENFLCKFCCNLVTFLKMGSKTCNVKSHNLEADEFLKCYGFKSNTISTNVSPSCKKKRRKLEQIKKLKEAVEVAKEIAEEEKDKDYSDSDSEDNDGLIEDLEDMDENELDLLLLESQDLQ
ncbi:hypothetical protein ABK040_012307 [Willaertia magna]